MKFFEKLLNYIVPEPIEIKHQRNPATVVSKKLPMVRQGLRQTGRINIKAGNKEYWRECWVEKGDRLVGAYRVGQRCFTGEIILRPRLKFLILLRSTDREKVCVDGPHSACFLARRAEKDGDGTWYEVHWKKWHGNSPDSGIVAIECTLAESIGRN